ncbi:MAG: hypothetical protein ABSG33_11135 [Candidatus Bathyarchaeia archaeon]
MEKREKLEKSKRDSDKIRNLPEWQENQLTERQRKRMKKGVEGLLSLRSEVTEKWKDPPGVVEEIRRSRRHDRE